MVKAALAVCGRSERGVLNPWVIGHEEELGEMTTRVNEAVNVRNDCMNALNNRRRLRARTARNARLRGDMWMTELEDRLTEAKTRVRQARKAVKRFLRRIETSWWEERIRECREACDRGRIGDMYKSLRKIGTKGSKAPESSMITVREFKEHFESIECEV